MATISENVHATTPASEQGSTALDPALLYEKTGMTLEKLRTELDQLDLEELQSLEHILGVIDSLLRFLDHGVQCVMRRSGGILKRIEHFVQRYVNVF